VRLKFNPLAEVAASGSSWSTTRSCAATRRGRSCRCSSTRRGRGARAGLVAAVVSPCFYGIDLADPDEMIAGAALGRGGPRADRRHLARLSLARRAVAATRRPESELCRACLTRDYPTAVPAEHAKLRFEAARA
jgi:amidophosphoribosyltransferase